MRHSVILPLGALLAFACSNSPEATGSSSAADTADGGAPILSLSCPRRAVGVLPRTGTWTRTAIAVAEAWSRDGYNGTGTTISLTASGEPRIAYYSSESVCFGTWGWDRSGALFLAQPSATAPSTALWDKRSLACDSSGFYPSIATGGAGGLHLAFSAQRHDESVGRVFYKYWTGDASSWSQLVGGMPSFNGSSAITTDCNGVPLVLSNGKLLAPTKAAAGLRSTVFADPAGSAYLVRDARGHLHAASDVMVTVGSSGHGEARYAEYDGSAWTVADPTGGAGGHLLGFDIGPDNTPHVLYQSATGTDTWLAVRGPAGWTSKQLRSGRFSGNVAFAIDGAGEPIAILDSQFARLPSAATTWSTTFAVPGAQATSLLIDGAGNLHASYMHIDAPYSNGTSPSQVYYARFSP